jgi:hypothetical protein
MKPEDLEEAAGSAAGGIMTLFSFLKISHLGDTRALWKICVNV